MADLTHPQQERIIDRHAERLYDAYWATFPGVHVVPFALANRMVQDAWRTLARMTAQMIGQALREQREGKRS